MSTRMALTSQAGGRFLRIYWAQLHLNQSRNGLLIASRCLSCSTVRYKKSPPHVKLPSKVKLYVEKKYMGFTGRMERQLESRYPRAHKLYVLVKQGMKTFFADSKTLYGVSTDMWKGKEISHFSYNELDVYRQMPRDMLKVAPVLIIAALPFAPYVIFPIAFLMPRHLLCRHFWTEEEQAQFGEQALRKRTQHYPKILHYMEKHSRDVKDLGHRRLLEGIIHKLENKSCPSAEEIIEVKPVFQDNQPFGRAFLESRHILLKRHLARSLGSSMWRDRVGELGLLIHHTDLALSKHGVGSLTSVQATQACFLRGMNAAKCDHQEKTKYLDTWIQVSKHVDESTLSLLLHCPIFLAMNHPANSRFSPQHFYL